VTLFQNVCVAIMVLLAVLTGATARTRADWTRAWCIVGMIWITGIYHLLFVNPE